MPWLSILILLDLCHTSRLWKTSLNSLAVKYKRKCTLILFIIRKPCMQQNLALNTELNCMLQYIYNIFTHQTDDDKEKY